MIMTMYFLIILLCLCCGIITPLGLKKTLTKSSDGDCDSNVSKHCHAITSSASCQQEEENSSLRTIHWGGSNITAAEICGLKDLRTQLYQSTNAADSSAVWLNEATDVELLRFLRAKHGNVDEALKMIQAHMTWRSSEYGADSDFIKTAFVNSPLRHEIFWLGLNKDNCPTMVIRTQVHDGIYYDEDPKIFVR